MEGFFVVGFSPSPEDIEHTNVGVISFVGGEYTLYTNKGFPLLHKQTEDFSGRLLSTSLDYITRKIQGSLPSEVPSIIIGMSSQYSITNLVECDLSSDNDSIATILHNY